MGDGRSTDGLVDTWRVHWPYVKLSAVLFVLGLLAGAAAWDRVDLLGAFGFEEEALFEGGEVELTTGFVLVNNTMVFGLVIVGVFSLGLLTALILLFNGFLVGYIAVPIALEEGLGVVLVGLVPHGILELPALFVAAAVAFRLIHRGAAYVRGRREHVTTRAELRRAGALLALAWVVLAIAAVVEAHVTVRLLEALYPEAVG